MTDKQPASANNVVSLSDRSKREKAILTYAEFASDDANTSRINDAMSIAIEAIELAFPGIELADSDKAFLFESAIAAVMRGKGAVHPLHETIDNVYEQIKDQYSF